MINILRFESYINATDMKVKHSIVSFSAASDPCAFSDSYGGRLAGTSKTSDGRQYSVIMGERPGASKMIQTSDLSGWWQPP